MFEALTWAYGLAWWVVGRLNKIEKETFKSLKDPGVFISAALAGGVARTIVFPLDHGGAKGFTQTIGRRMPQFGFLMMFYCPVAHRLLPGTEADPLSKMLTTFMVGAMAGFNMRLVCNPISRVMDECARTGQKPQDVMRILKNKTILQFWYTTPNLIANALYFGTLFTVFEGLRRFSERSLLPLVTNEGAGALLASDEVAKATGETKEVAGDLIRTFNMQNYTTQVVQNFVVGGTAAAVATTVCYPYSAHRYLQTVIYDSALCRGLLPTLIKEVPMMAAMFGCFSLLQPLFAPRHGARCGFGY
ncbi:hypothetical protein STCU_00977 [Strigomonas culicis]|uniref:Mitochondrial carrier protein n=1 Tax=Strigomonas culicis TaxID=28005 RepID=S9UXW5_9TRYP|nr:hypothetical protein STCU_06996 [Strigomonas culicis]EPY29984.1 hypothetical protein STCU_04294 [Strigomonas culicis]EPY35697.1 hypothetical protein STCU_00977 [Strigomonas culicis]|eukprot:EPY24804.1 hypothetical protein STCU_06996 [Strigomonas culicis]